MATVVPVLKLNDDCLERVFIACQGNPLTLNALSEVCVRFYHMSKRASVWRCLKIDNISQYGLYSRFLLSPHNQYKVKAVRELILAKPRESRHAHVDPLPMDLSRITHIYTFNLCLAEIEYLSNQFQESKATLYSLICTNIETWCGSRRFSFDLFEPLAELREVCFEFVDDGQSGFASIHGSVYDSTESTDDEGSHSYDTLKLTSIRDWEGTEQRRLLHLMQEVEEDGAEAYRPEDIEFVENKKNLLLENWSELERSLERKYGFLSSVKQLEQLSFGSCHAWTPVIWRQVFQQVMMGSPKLRYLELHGWDQLGKLEKAGPRSSTIQPTRVVAEEAIAESFEFMPSLATLHLVDFSIGPGLLKAGKTSLSNKLECLDITLSKTFVRYFTEKADLWLLVGPLKEFIQSVFPATQNSKPRTVNLNLHQELLYIIEDSPYFADEPLLESLQDNLKESNVKISLNEIYHL